MKEEGMREGKGEGKGGRDQDRKRKRGRKGSREQESSGRQRLKRKKRGNPAAEGYVGDRRRLRSDGLGEKGALASMARGMQVRDGI
jgi:hypothetical protein